MIWFNRSLLPRSGEKRPRRLKLEIKIDWHFKCNRLYKNIPKFCPARWSILSGISPWLTRAFNLHPRGRRYYPPWQILSCESTPCPYLIWVSSPRVVPRLPTLHSVWCAHAAPRFVCLSTTSGHCCRYIITYLICIQCCHHDHTCVRVCMCVSTCVCMWLFLCVHVCVCGFVRVRVRMCEYVWMYPCECVCVCVSLSMRTV